MEKQGMKKKFIIVLVILVILLLGLFALLQMFTITQIDIEGNERYTAEEIKEMIMTEKYDYNTLYFYWRMNSKETKEIPFIDTIEVSVVSKNKVKIKVYEKDIVGYVQHLGYYLYFDKEGIVVESSTQLMEGVPKIKGIAFENVEKLRPAQPHLGSQIFYGNFIKEIDLNKIKGKTQRIVCGFDDAFLRFVIAHKQT